MYGNDFMLKKILPVFVIIGVVCVVGGLYFLREKNREKNNVSKELVLSTLYGDFTITEPVLIDLINDKYVQRLKDIRQYGTNYYTVKKQEYNRFDHSVGVFVLLRKFGAPLNEQIAGLLHDVSHTVFSHVGDFLFKISQLGENSYQDNNHENFIKSTSIPEILKKHGISVQDILHKNDGFTLLEQNLPEVCADRLEYNLQGGFVDGLLTSDDIQQIVNNIVVEDGRWIFTDPELAKKVAHVPFYFMQNINGWNNYKCYMANEYSAAVLQRALAIGLITLDDIYFSTDELVWNKLIQSDDTELQSHLQKALHVEEHIKCVETDEYDMLIKNKFRGINPWVKTDKGIMRLTELDQDFNKNYTEVKRYMEAGWRIKLLS